MSKKRMILLKSRLGMRLFGVMVVAMLAAIGVFTGISAIGNSLDWDSPLVQRYFSKQFVERAIEQLQEFVTLNKVSSTDYFKLQLWMSEGRGVGLVYGSEDVADSPYTIVFADKTVGVYPYVYFERFAKYMQIIGFLLAFSCFLAILLLALRKLTEDIARLSADMNVLTGGDLTHEIRSKRKDELGELARDIEAMRISVTEQMNKESEAVNANRELITALSHDLRTPLTKQIGYLEVIMAGDCMDEATLKSYIERIHHAAYQVKERSDQLFKHFLVSDDPKKAGEEKERIDGALMLGQVLSEQEAFLVSKGFRTDYIIAFEPFFLTMNPLDIERIIDNITSNIIKYADPAFPVRARVETEVASQVTIRIENYMRIDNKRNRGTKIGMQSSRALAQKYGGEFTCICQGEVFHSILRLPVAFEQSGQETEPSA
ncbi:MAG: HAMP domain-containing sensor histidine kinase [Candidatus Limiplasma sp.]|nr:HAMP domain-containing sensor histidine kinase [Candidatus Limiplasma sp.]